MATQLRVLVADDNSDAAIVLAQLLRERGHTVRTATDGQSAVDLAVIFHPQVSVLDIDMPLLSGHEVARFLRRQPWARQMVIVALSGWKQDRDRALAREAGFDYQLTKPADIESLMGLFETAHR